MSTLRELKTIGSPKRIHQAYDALKALTPEKREHLRVYVECLTNPADEFEMKDAWDGLLELLDINLAEFEPFVTKEEAQDPKLLLTGEIRKWVDYVGGRIKALRDQLGMTQFELEERSGVPQSYISRIENGVHSPTHLTVEKLAKGLGVPPGELDPSYS
jgi:DNA-binding XRE family transcriptional regulator